MTLATAGHPVAVPRVSVYEGVVDIHVRLIRMAAGRIVTEVIQGTPADLEMVAAAIVQALARLAAEDTPCP